VKYPGEGRKLLPTRGARVVVSSDRDGSCERSGEARRFKSARSTGAREGQPRR
jgi:hypothetical protein